MFRKGYSYSALSATLRDIFFPSMTDVSGSIAGTITEIEPAIIEKALRTGRRAFGG
jgi:hypothetical protein